MLTLDIKQYNLTKITITVVNRPPNENYFVLDTLYHNKKNPKNKQIKKINPEHNIPRLISFWIFLKSAF